MHMHYSRDGRAGILNVKVGPCPTRPAPRYATALLLGPESLENEIDAKFNVLSNNLPDKEENSSCHRLLTPWNQETLMRNQQSLFCWPRTRVREKNATMKFCIMVLIARHRKGWVWPGDGAEL